MWNGLYVPFLNVWAGKLLWARDIPYSRHLRYMCPTVIVPKCGRTHSFPSCTPTHLSRCEKKETVRYSWRIVIAVIGGTIVKCIQAYTNCWKTSRKRTLQLSVNTKLNCVPRVVWIFKLISTVISSCMDLNIIGNLSRKCSSFNFMTV